MTGLNGCLLDYSMVVIGTNMGIVGTTKEHIGIALALDIPNFITTSSRNGTLFELIILLK